MKKFFLISVAILATIVLLPVVVGGLVYFNSFKYALTIEQKAYPEIDAMTHYGSEYVRKAGLLQRFHFIEIEFLTPFYRLEDMNQIWLPAQSMDGGSQYVSVVKVRFPPDKLKIDINYSYNGEDIPIAGKYVYKKHHYSEKLRKVIYNGDDLDAPYIHEGPQDSYYYIQTYNLPLSQLLLPNALKFKDGVKAKITLEIHEKGEIKTIEYDVLLHWKKVGDMFDFLLMF